MEIEDVKQKVDRLKGLLDHPEPGLFTWHGAVQQAGKEVAEVFMPRWWNQGEEGYHPEWGKVVVLDSNRDGFGHMRCRQLDTEAEAIVPASPECLTKDPPACRGCKKGRLARRASDRLFACTNCGKTASQVREAEGT